MGAGVLRASMARERSISGETRWIIWNDNHMPDRATAMISDGRDRSTHGEKNLTGA